MRETTIRIPRTEGMGRIAFERFYCQALTTFTLPDSTLSDPEAYHFHGPSIKNQMPFDCFCIKERITATGFNVSMDALSTIVVSFNHDDNAIELAGQLRRLPFQGHQPRYMYGETGTSATTQLITLQRFFDQLYSRKFRFIEEAVSRQVRRSENRPAGYREYILIPRTDHRYDSAIRPGAILQRLRPLHAVRGHLRTYRDDRYVNVKGKTQPIAPFVRGVGDALQIKDYKVR